MSPLRYALLPAALAVVLGTACKGSVQTAAGGAGGVVTTSSSGSGAASSSSSGAASSSSSGGTMCISTCGIDADCQDTCPLPAAGTIYCCDSSTTQCYISPIPICAVPCTAGNTCQPGATCTPADGCVSQCTCDGTGHYACTTPPSPACPSPHAACGAPCDPSLPLACVCAAPGSAAPEPCWCDGASSRWACDADAGACPPEGHIKPGTTCTDYPVGTTCGAFPCVCSATCGTQMWQCL